MHNSREKKNFSITHRRIKTDISQSYQSRNYASLTETKSINHNVRHKTENRDFKSSNFSRMDFDSSRSYIRSPNLAHKLTYNKWFIKPQNRLKQSLLQLKPKENDIQFAYNKLYEQNICQEQCPFQANKNEKLKLLQKIPVHNLRLLDEFKKQQELKKKRVPKIIQLFLKKKNNFCQS